MSGVVALNSRRPLSISVRFRQLSDCAGFPAKTEEHGAGARGKKGERGRFRNRRDVAELQEVDLGGRTNVGATQRIHRKRLRSGPIGHKCAENILSGAAATRSV